MEFTQRGHFPTVGKCPCFPCHIQGRLKQPILIIACRLPETLSQEILSKMGAIEAQKAMEKVPICTVDELATADAIIFGTPTRFGNMCGQMRQFLDATGGALGQRRTGWQGGQCFYEFRNTARGTGIHHFDLHHNSVAPRVGHCGAALQFPGSDAQ
jgi:multimeric flavodoxin WrbA